MPARSVPSLISPKYVSTSVGATIHLRQATVELRGEKSGFVATGTGDARLVLSPRDRLIVSVSLPATSQALDLTRRDNDLSLKFGPAAIPVPIIAIRTTFTQTSVELDCLPRSQPLIPCAGRGVRLTRAIVHLLNFPQFYCLGKGGSDIHHDDGTKRRLLGRVLLEHGGWRIEIQELQGTSALIKELKAQGGNAITHIIQLTRTSGRSFTAPALGRAVHDLHRFLSFAKGHWVPIFGIIGWSADGSLGYEDWGTRLSAPWQSPRGWFDIHHGELLAEAYPGFTDLLHNGEMKRAVAAALYWYLQSNRAGDGAGIDSGLILAHAALERLASAHADRRGLAITKPPSAANTMRAAFADLSLPLDIPKQLSKLRAAAKRDDFTDGPGALSAIRNELVHPKQRLSSPLSPLIVEGWKLAQWYVEVMLLRLSGYKGSYSNRLSARWVGEIETLP